MNIFKHVDGCCCEECSNPVHDRGCTCTRCAPDPGEPGPYIKNPAAGPWNDDMEAAKKDRKVVLVVDEYGRQFTGWYEQPNAINRTGGWECRFVLPLKPIAWAEINLPDKS